MKNLIEALQIFGKYTTTEWPTNCCHDVLCIMQVEKDQPTEDERARLHELGFFWSDEYDCWASFKYGSA